MEGSRRVRNARHTGPGIGMENAKRERIWFSPHCLAPAALAAAA
jgi:hypothetical protein